MCVVCALAAGIRGADRLEADAFPAESAPFPWRDGRPVGGLLTWTGAAGFVIEAGGARVALDPFVTRPGLFSALFRRASPDRGAVARAFSGLDAVFLGHAHFDHAMDVAAVAEASPRARIHGG